MLLKVSASRGVLGARLPSSLSYALLQNPQFALIVLDSQPFERLASTAVDDAGEVDEEVEGDGGDSGPAHDADRV